MPLTQIDYQKGIIYKIQHLENEEFLYVGSTTNFIKRKQCHKKRCNLINNEHYNLKVYQMIRDNGGWDQFKMMIIKEFPCNNKIELLIEEDKIMREMKSNMNNNRSHLTDEEKKEQVNEYHLNNKEKVKGYKTKYKFNNKEKIKNQNANYRLNNKEKINEKIVCQCGSETSIHHISRHKQTIKHKKYLETLDKLVGLKDTSTINILVNK
jgi:hypothetical protein